MGYSARLEFTGHTEGEGITSGLAGTLAHHERSFRLLAQYLQRYLSGITVRIINDRWAGISFFCEKHGGEGKGKRRSDLNVPVTKRKLEPLETGLRTGSPDEYLKLARGDVLFRRTEKAPKAARARVCVYILILRHAVMSRGPTWVFQLETRALCVARPPRFDYSGCLFSRVKAAGLAWSHECFRQRAPSCSTC